MPTNAAADETRRLAALRACGILDTEPEPAFDALVARAARAAATPYAFIGLLDGERVWFKSAFGAERREVSSGEAIALDTIRSEGVYWVGDLTRRPKHCKYFWVTHAPFIRFYAGAALKLSSGDAVGALFVAGTEPRRRSRRVVQELEELASIASALIEARRTAALKEESERLLATFLDGAPAALAMFDRELRYLRVSPQWRIDYGLESEELIGRSHYEVFPEIGEDWKGVHRRCLAGATERRAREKFVRADGREQWLTWEVRPWRDAAGDIGGLVMLTRDLTREVEATLKTERTAERLKRALEIGRAFMWEYDLRDGGVFIDGRPELVIGSPLPLKAIPRDALEMAPAADRAAAFERWNNCLGSGTPFAAEHRIVDANGRERWVLAMGEAKRDATGVVCGAVGLVQDITVRKEAELQLEAARDIAEKANRSKSGFLATISHEMRTPLNGVLGLAHALSQTPLHAAQRDLLDGIVRSGDTLLALLNDILDSARIEAGQLSLTEEAFGVDDLLTDIIALYKERATTKGLTFTVSCEDVRGRWRGDPLRIRQVLLNLIGNAVKFTLTGGVHIAISRRPEGRACERLVFRVRDTGIGFDKETRARLFNRFAQGDRETARRFGGTGLGLSICRGLVELMGGEIDCRSEPDRGSEFWFSAPFPRVDEGAVRGEEAPAEALKLRVLCVDDHPVNREVLAQTLTHFGCIAEFAENGAEAVAAWEAGAFDLILMDLLMPVLDGEEAAKAIRAREAETGRPRTPILALSANAGADHAAACRAAGMDGHVAKPFQPRLLAAEMRAALGDAVLAKA